MLQVKGNETFDDVMNVPVVHHPLEECVVQTVEPPRAKTQEFVNTAGAAENC